MQKLGQRPTIWKNQDHDFSFKCCNPVKKRLRRIRDEQTKHKNNLLALGPRSRGLRHLLSSLQSTQEQNKVKFVNKTSTERMLIKDIMRDCRTEGDWGKRKGCGHYR